MRYELSFYIPEDRILYSQRRENLISYIIFRMYAGEGVSNELSRGATVLSGNKRLVTVEGPLYPNWE
jgi:hypothetical protein